MARNTLFALIPAAVVAGGCANALTFSESERAQGRIAYYEGDTERATSIFSEQVRLNPRDHRAHLHLGETQAAAGNTTDALRSFRTAMEARTLTPRGRADEEYRKLIVDAYASLLAKVDSDGTMAGELDARAKGDVTMKLLVARTHGEAGRPDAAIASFREARSLDRQDQLVAKQFGLYLESIRQDVAAEEMLRRAYALNPSDGDVAAGLRRLGIVPGPAILSRNDLARPMVPLGPLPEVRLHDSVAEAAAAAVADDELN